jgi:adenylosuccinate synthase
VCDTTRLLGDGLRLGKEVLLEGQLGALKDPDHGLYPFVTSSSTLAGFASVGAGIAPHAIRRIIAVTKAYSSTVGRGPFVTELNGLPEQELRARGGDAGEYGAMTGRPRRVGWFDAVATRYGCRVQGATEVALTCLDVLGYLSEIPICVGYELFGVATTELPSPREIELARPLYELLPGWQCSISTARSMRELPAAAARYIQRIEELIEAPIRLVSVGPSRESMFERE